MIESQTGRLPDPEIQAEIERLDRNVRAAVDAVGALVLHAGQLTSDLPELLICDGRLLSVLRYPRLYAAIGNTYGGSRAGGTFALPDFRAKIPQGADPGDASARAGTATTVTVGTGASSVALLNVTVLVRADSGAGG